MFLYFNNNKITYVNIFDQMYIHWQVESLQFGATEGNHKF